MLKRRILAGQLAAAVLLPATAAQGETLQKFQTFQQVPIPYATKQGVIPYQIPGTKTFQSGSVGLFGDFEAQVKRLPYEEKSKLISDFLTKRQAAKIAGNPTTEQYYEQLLSIIFRHMSLDK